MPLDSEQVTALKVLFEAFDLDNDGCISIHDFESIALQFTIDQTGRANAVIIQQILPREDETINVVRFVALIESSFDVATSQLEVSSTLPFSIILYCLLEEKRAAFVSRGKYVEAGEIQNQLDILFRAEVTKRHQILRAKEARSFDIIKKAHSDQYIAYEKEWDEFDLSFERRLAVAIDSLKQQQESNMENMTKKLEAEARSTPPVWSKELKEWRKRERILAFQEHYSEAQKVKLISDSLEEEELRKKDDKSKGTLERKKNNYVQQQRAEMAVFLKRIHAARSANANKRKLNCQRLLQRNQNTQAYLKSKAMAEAQVQFTSIEKNVRKEIDERMKKQQKTERKLKISRTNSMLPSAAVFT